MKKLTHIDLKPLAQPMILTLLLWLGSYVTLAQSTAFTYQGKLNDNAAPANGAYDFQFKLFDALAAGTQVGATNSLTNISVSNGVFTVMLDFGAAAFPGANRWLEINVRLAGGGAFTTLSPRQPITATPYALRSLSAAAADSLSAACVGCVTSTQIGTLPANSGSYIQNTNSPQASANFNISGNGTAGGTLSGNLVNATTQYNLNGSRMLSNPGTNNLFVGIGAGSSNTTGSNNSYFGIAVGNANQAGSFNSFFGSGAGFANSGHHNSFLGHNAGFSNTAGSDNSFFGKNAGYSNTTGPHNNFFGRSAGEATTTGGYNSFFGTYAGYSNTVGASNSFFGVFAGLQNTTGSENTFFGNSAGFANTTASGNSFFGRSAGLLNSTGNLNSFFGHQAANFNTTGSENSFFGAEAGFNNTTGQGNSFFGDYAGFSNDTAGANSFFGSGAGYSNTGFGNSFFGQQAGNSTTTGSTNTFIGRQAGFTNTTGSNNTALGFGADVSVGFFTFATAIGAGAVVMSSNTILLGRNSGADRVVVPGLGTAGATSLCRNTANQIATCSSSARYKTRITSFNSGLAIIRQLRPVTFEWKADQQLDLGLVAEEVAALEPLLVTHNAQGEIEGIKYAQLGVVLINAIKQQQAMIERQQRDIARLKQLLCTRQAQADVCRQRESPDK